MARRYEFYVLVARTISNSFAALTREILLLPLEHKIHIFSPPCNILYLFELGGNTFSRAADARDLTITKKTSFCFLEVEKFSKVVS